MTRDRFLLAVEAALPRQGFWQSPTVIGVSGGADSTALLLALSVLAPDANAGASLVVAHAEYDLRPEASADRDAVAALAGRLGIRFVTRRLEVCGAGHPRGEGIEARARRLRYRWFEDVARETGSRRVAVAHTADDQAETLLHRILRGTGPAGMAGMAAARQLCEGVALIRPLLTIRRWQVRGWLLANGQQWCEDATNCDTRHARNFLRHEIIRRCEEGPYPAASEAIVRLGRQVSASSEVVAEAAAHLLGRVSMRQTDGAVLLRPRELAGLSESLLAEVVVALWRREGWPRREMTSSHYKAAAAILAAAAAGDVSSGGIDLPGGLRAAVAAGGQVRVGPAQLSPQPAPLSRR